MGKGRMGKGKKRARVENFDDQQKVRMSYQGSDKCNDTFEKYYRAQQILKNDEEFELFLNTMKQPLPVAFRINLACYGQTQALKNIVESEEFVDVLDKDGTCKDGITKLNWYPKGLAYQLNLSRPQIRSNEKLLNLHTFLISETENGYISRQETVSFIPPIMLDIQPHHKVLDLCAAPGSKTAQIIEFLHGDKKIGDKDEGENQGFIVANDVNTPRCYMLTHQCKRFNLPYFMITNEDASMMPNFYCTNKETGEKEKFKFDRILADVPCTGDGTMRKNNDIWKKWLSQGANHISILQLKIAKRAAELLAKDGLMVYSTCSLNPVEDEVVIMNLLRESEGCMELVDVEDKLPSLKRRNGVEKWALMQKNQKIVNSFEEVDEDSKQQLNANMFPPKDVEKYNLKRCVRILPFLQNTGGFFIALLRKKTDTLPWQPEHKSATNPNKKQRLEKKPIPNKEYPFNFVIKNDPTWLAIKDFYSISDDFPSQRLFYRSEKGLNHLNYISDGAIDLFNSSCDKVKFVNFGVRVFGKIQDKHVGATHRIAQDGLGILYPYLAKERIINISGEMFEKLMKCEDHLNLDEIEESTRDEINKFPSGCVVLEYKLPVKQDNGQFEDLPLPIAAWKGKLSVRPFVNKHERMHYRRICGFDLSSLDSERKRVFDERVKRRTERIERVRKAKEANGLESNGNAMDDKNDLENDECSTDVKDDDDLEDSAIEAKEDLGNNESAMKDKEIKLEEQ